MQEIRINQTNYEEPGIRKGTLSFTPQHLDTDITSLRFFKVDFRYIVDYGLGQFVTIFPGTYGYEVGDTNGLVMLSRKRAYPDIWLSADSLAKSAHSTVLVDLGQRSADNNITNPTYLQRYTKVFDDLPFIANARPGPANESYNRLKDEIGPLENSPSVIATEYLCQVPKRKSIANLLVPILVADIVFLSAIWTVFTFTTDIVFLRKTPRAQSCAGCDAILAEGARRSIAHDIRPSDDDNDHISLQTFTATPKHGASRESVHQRSASEQHLLPRPPFQRQPTDYQVLR